MLNKVRIFEASVFNSELTPISPARNWIHVTCGRATARSYDLACPGVVPPLVGGLSAVSFHLYSGADMSTVPLITQ